MAIPLSSDGASGSAPRVLVVDDRPDFREAARLLLERRGYAVVAEAGCAATALDAVERFAPDAVLLDVRLGDDDGFDVCRKLTRARPGLAVLLTSTSEYDHWAGLLEPCSRPRLALCRGEVLSEVCGGSPSALPVPV